MSVIVDLKHNQRPTIDDLENEMDQITERAYYRYGEILKTIRDEKLYRVQGLSVQDSEQVTFEQYCEQEREMSQPRAQQFIDAFSDISKIITNCNDFQIPHKESHARELIKLKTEDGNQDRHRADVWQRCLNSGQKITAKFIGEQVQKKLAELSKDWITLDEWKQIDTADKSNALVRASSKTFNKQDNASIEWAQWSWNPVTGCLHDCPYCYARDIAERFYPDEVGFSPAIYPGRLQMPLNTNVPAKAAQDIAFKNVFACSMADLFGRWVPAEWIDAVLNTAGNNEDWNFLFLTKFPKRMAEFDIPDNCWMGTSVDCQARVKNAEKAFANVNSGVKWLSVEPMLEPLKFERLELFDWIVIGGASSSKNTPEWMPPIDWIVNLHQQARDAGCKIYYKSNCGMTESLRIKEFPWVDTIEKEPPSVFKYLGKAKGENQKAE